MNFKKLFLVTILCLFSSVSWSDKCVQGDCKNGLGTYLWDSGDKYVGEFSNGLPNGEGLITTADGDIYEGEWLDDKANGMGTYTHANGAKYHGEWRDDKQHGTGRRPGLTAPFTKVNIMKERRTVKESSLLLTNLSIKESSK